MDKYFMWVHYERLHNYNKAKHNKTVCIFLGIYCTSMKWVIIDDLRFIDVQTSLSDWSRDKMVAISQTTFPNAFPWMKMHEFRLRFHWSLFLRSNIYVPALVQIMAWRRPGGKPLSESMVVSLLTQIHVTRPQWAEKKADGIWIYEGVWSPNINATCEKIHQQNIDISQPFFHSITNYAHSSPLKVSWGKTFRTYDMVVYVSSHYIGLRHIERQWRKGTNMKCYRR